MAGVLVGSLAARAQDNSTTNAAAAAGTTNTNAVAASPAVDPTIAGPGSTNAATDGAVSGPAVHADTAKSAEAPAASAVANTNSVADASAPAAAPADTNAPAAAPVAAAAPAAPITDTNAPAGTNAIIPLIVMDDVPLTDAIKNLARQAGINYMLDPRVSFGQVGPDGKPVAQPNVSIRWENVTASQALNALLSNYNLDMVEEPRSKISRITPRDPAAPDPLVTRVVQLHYASPTNILVAIGNALIDKRSKVIADVRTSQLVILSTEKELASVEPLVAKLDTPTKQVLIEARLLETSMNPSTTKGMDWSGTLAAQHLSFGNNLQTAPVPSDSANAPLATLWPKMMFDTAKGFNPATAFLDADGVSAVLSFLNKYGEAKVLSSPRTVTLDNETATIEVTRASPIINVTPGTVQVSGGSQITYTNLGVILHVTPRISANNYVNLKVTPEVSRIADTLQRVVNNGTFQVDEYDVRKIDTRVMIPSGNTLVLGGLVQDDVRQQDVKVPLLGDIPILGGAFRSQSKNRQKSNLMVFLTPTIVQDGDFQPTQTDFLKHPVPNKDTVDEDWSSWNSGKPKDWKKKQSEEPTAAAQSPEVKGDFAEISR
jgi:type IV pilus assembly protein PilQ